MANQYILLCPETKEYIHLGKRQSGKNAPYQGLVEQTLDGQPWADPRHAVYCFVCTVLDDELTLVIVDIESINSGEHYAEVSARFVSA